MSITDLAKKMWKRIYWAWDIRNLVGKGSKKYFFQKRKKHDFFNFLNLDVSKMDWNNGFNSSFFVGFPNNPNLDVSGHFGCKFFFWWLPLSAKAVSIYRLTGSRELILSLPIWQFFFLRLTELNEFVFVLSMKWWNLNYSRAPSGSSH